MAERTASYRAPAGLGRHESKRPARVISLVRAGRSVALGEASTASRRLSAAAASSCCRRSRYVWVMWGGIMNVMAGRPLGLLG